MRPEGRPGAGQQNYIDRITQCWVRASGRKVLFSQFPWLQGPVGEPEIIASAWIEQEAERCGAVPAEGVGLLTDMALLSGSDFDPSLLAADVVSFYVNTSDWIMDVSYAWSRIALPAGWLLSKLFTRRLQQLNLPIRRSKVTHCIKSRIVSLRREDGEQLGVAWIRTLPATGQYVYSGWYGIARLPSGDGPCLRVVFPLPNGNLIVFLRPEIGENGTLILKSPLGKFGEPGAYLVVMHPGEESGWVRRVPICEEFVVGVVSEGYLYTDHFLRLWNIPVVQFRYRLKRALIQNW